MVAAKREMIAKSEKQDPLASALQKYRLSSRKSRARLKYRMISERLRLKAAESAWAPNHLHIAELTRSNSVFRTSSQQNIVFAASKARCFAVQRASASLSMKFSTH